jgi:transcription termination factor Rho
MSVLDRSALEASPLADLHAIASELGIDGFRRLRKAALIDAIVDRQGAGEDADEGASMGSGGSTDAAADASDASAADDATPSASDASTASDADDSAASASDASTTDDSAASGDAAPSASADADEAPRRRRRRGGRRRRSADDDSAEAASDRDENADEPEDAGETEAEDVVVEGTVELLGGGSGFVRVSPPDPSDQDVYISAAQVRRCELVSGDVIAGPVRPPRRSERYPSLVRVDTINDAPADEVTAGTRYEDMPCAFPAERLALGGEDTTVRAIEWLTPFGKGSRVAITGPARAGKTEALRRIAAALATQTGDGDGAGALEVSLVLAGVRPEEAADWQDDSLAPGAATVLGTSPDSQAQAIERVVEQARRVAARGRDAIVLVDGLDGLHPPAARKVLASARNLVEAGSLTIVATATAPVGGETTVIALNRELASTGRFPALDLAASGTVRPELLVGEAGAEAIAKARLESLER